ncbi:hypothetical protein Bca52824_047309 [Brassica carinata]|uniref:RNase H type-1 domain-containing protein n=1 Tax=Brassica carinata TaxID=52824 RepID=A0A8X7RGD4_BRACI|nr:hypothetical protein Bca52824_047309 [Brassica carinata]
MWYLWKARNGKLFNGVEVTPLDTLHKATREYDEWIVAQQALKGTTAKKRPHNNDQEERGRLHIPRCQVDASWATNQSTFGGGFVMELQDGTAMTGSLEVLTPLHAEMNSLIWAMRSSLHLRHDTMHFESDCLQMVKLIEEEEFWPPLAREWEDFFHTPDLLAKRARAKASEFSRINLLVPQGLAIQPNPFEPV